MFSDIMEEKIAIAQINTSVGDIESNTNKILDFIEKARSSGATLVIFPEMAITGYPPKDLLFSSEFINQSERAAEKIRLASKGIAVIVGGVEKLETKDNSLNKYDKSYSSKKLFNTAFVFSDGKLIYKYHKRHLPNYDVFDEKRYFNSGEEDGIFALNEKKIGLNICEDIWIENGPADVQARAGVQLIVNISSSPFYQGKISMRRKLIEDHIGRGHVPIVYVNQVGGQDELVFDGESYAYDKNGKMIAQCKHFEEDLAVFSLAEKPITAKTQSADEEIYGALKLGLRDYVRKNKFEKVVLGLSGGVDSALVATIAADALSPENVLCILMPSKFSSEHSISDAMDLVRNLGTKHELINIGPSYESFLHMLFPLFNDRAFGTTQENIQARARMVVLYAIANEFKYMVLNTSNKSEAAVGYGTIYGDMAGGYAVIGDVLKTQVYSLCKYVNLQAGYERIPGNILIKEPSAELSPGQLDKDSLPTYDILDKIVHSYVEEIKSPASIAVDEKIDIKIVKDIVRKINCAENKRYRNPIAPKITNRAFGTGRRMPITNGFE